MRAVKRPCLYLNVASQNIVCHNVMSKFSLIKMSISQKFANHNADSHNDNNMGILSAKSTF